MTINEEIDIKFNQITKKSIVLNLSGRGIQTFFSSKYKITKIASTKNKQIILRRNHAWNSNCFYNIKSQKASYQNKQIIFKATPFEQETNGVPDPISK